MEQTETERNERNFRTRKNFFIYFSIKARKRNVRQIQFHLTKIRNIKTNRRKRNISFD
jgi:hypothetical protein